MTDPEPHPGKYQALWRHLANRSERDRLEMTFAEIENVLGFSLPPSSRNHTAHWSGYDGSAVARAIHDAGWRAAQVNLTAESVVFAPR